MSMDVMSCHQWDNLMTWLLVNYHFDQLLQIVFVSDCHQLQVACNKCMLVLHLNIPFFLFCGCISFLATHEFDMLVKINQTFPDDKDDHDNLDCRDTSLQFCSQRRPLDTLLDLTWSPVNLQYFLRYSV